jgi:hypothetical protein
MALCVGGANAPECAAGTYSIGSGQGLTTAKLPNIHVSMVPVDPISTSVLCNSTQYTRQHGAILPKPTASALGRALRLFPFPAAILSLTHAERLSLNYQ